MSWGHVTSEMEAAIRPLVEGKEVWDLGAGDGDYARMILRLGAEHVHCVDKEKRRYPTFKHITVHETLFENLPLPEDGFSVGWVSWPTNSPGAAKGLGSLLCQADLVIYLGSNTGGSACGWSSLFRQALRRELIAHVPHHLNSLIAVGAPLPPGVIRDPVGDEWAALNGMCLSFEEAEAAAAERRPLCSI